MVFTVVVVVVVVIPFPLIYIYWRFNRQTLPDRYFSATTIAVAVDDAVAFCFVRFCFYLM